MNLINKYGTPNNIEVALRMKEFLGNDHRMLKYWGRGAKNYNINKIKFFRDIPDGVEILVDYVDVTARRTMRISSEIVYESIYRELPDLFEE